MIGDIDHRTPHVLNIEDLRRAAKPPASTRSLRLHRRGAETEWDTARERHAFEASHCVRVAPLLHSVRNGTTVLGTRSPCR